MKTLILIPAIALSIALSGCAPYPELPQPSGDKILINKNQKTASSQVVDDSIYSPDTNNLDIATPVMEKVNANEFKDVVLKGVSK